MDPTSHGSIVLLGQRAIQLVHEDLELRSRAQGLGSAVQHFRRNEQRRQIRALGLATIRWLESSIENAESGVSTHLKNMKVNWDDYSQHMGK